MSSTGTDRQNSTRKITLIVLGVVLAGTVFLLPRFVDEPWVAGEDELPEVPQGPTAQVAPSTAAELTRFRQESQSVLAEVMASRDRLEEAGVSEWAEVEFRQSLDRVEAGDEVYSYGEYDKSLEHYRQARDGLAAIEAQGQQKLAAAKADAREAIESLNVNTARSAIGLASTIAPQDREVQELATRVDVLPQLAESIQAGDEALARDRYQEAATAYRKAIELDPGHRRAADSLARANREVTNSVFRGHMSRGFSALERQDFDGARSAFREAGKIRPGDPAVQSALEQADNRETGRYVTREIERAVELERNENWQQAAAVYEELLARDPSLTDARVKLIPARVRADLDERLVGFIDDPLRLSSQSGHQAAQAALQDARGIARPGPRLAGQIEQLDRLLTLASSPVNVVFHSDNQTHVVLFRVAELGQFDQVSMKLRPGKYVAAGTRRGFRDVRVEFIVTGEEPQQQVVVRCEEPVS